MLLAAVAVAGAACEEKNEPRVMVEHIYSKQIIADHVLQDKSSGDYELFIERLCESDLEWYEEIWYCSEAEYPRVDLSDPIYALQYMPKVAVPKGVERRGFLFLDEGALRVWLLADGDQEGESMSGQWGYDATNGMLRISYTLLNGDSCTMEFILESVEARAAVVTHIDTEGRANYYYWSGKWNPGNEEN